MRLEFGWRACKWQRFMTRPKGKAATGKRAALQSPSLVSHSQRAETPGCRFPALSFRKPLKRLQADQRLDRLHALVLVHSQRPGVRSPRAGPKYTAYCCVISEQLNAPRRAAFLALGAPGWRGARLRARAAGLGSSRAEKLKATGGMI